MLNLKDLDSKAADGKSLLIQGNYLKYIKLYKILMHASMLMISTQHTPCIIDYLQKYNYL